VNVLVLREQPSQFLRLILYHFVRFVNFVHFCYTDVNHTITKNLLLRQAGKKEGGLGEGIFACLLCPAKQGWEWESVSAIPASAGRQNRKIFVSLIEKIFGGVQLKNVEKIFLFCSPQGGRKRWAGFLPVRAEIVARKRFELRSVIATRRNFI